MRLRGLQIAIFAGGVAGALARTALVRWLPVGSGWPWPTFIANVTGTILLGYLATRLQERLPPSTFRRPFLGTGFCGAFTTFSTLQVEVIRMSRDGHWALAASYLATSLAAGLVGVYLATALVRRARVR